MRCQARQFSAAILLLACLTPVTAQDWAAARALVVIDLRPAEERTGTGLSPLTGICNENVYSVADSASQPLKVDALQSELEKALGDTGAGKTLVMDGPAVFAAAGLAKSDLWATGWQAMRIAAPTYIVPFMFIYEPSLMLSLDEPVRSRTPRKSFRPG